MFAAMTTATCNYSRMARASVARVTDDYARLLEAAAALRPGRDVAGRPAALARFLNISQQNLRHWEQRGIAQREYVRVAGLVGCRAEWRATGDGAMTLDEHVPEPAPANSMSAMAASVVSQVYAVDAAGKLSREVVRLLEGILALASQAQPRQESDKATVAIPAKAKTTQKRSA